MMLVLSLSSFLALINGGATVVADDSESVRAAALKMLRSASTASLVAKEKQHYDQAWLLVALHECVAGGVLDESEVRDALEGTRYDLSTFWDADEAQDGSTGVLEYLRRGSEDAVDSVERGALSGKSVGDRLSLVAGVLTPLFWSSDAFDLDRARAVVGDWQLRFDDDAEFGPGFVTRVDDSSYTFYRQQSESRPQQNSGGASDESTGWNFPDGFRDAHQVVWEDDLAMGALVAATLAEHHGVATAEADRVAELLLGVARGAHQLFGADQQHAFDLTTGEPSPVSWSRAAGWGCMGLALIARSLDHLGHPADAWVVAGWLVSRLRNLDGGFLRQVMGSDVEGNYVEVSGSALVFASAAELKRQCRLPTDLEPLLREGVSFLVDAVDDAGDVANCSVGSSIGASAEYYTGKRPHDPADNSKSPLVLLALALAADNRTTSCDAGCADSESWHKKGDTAKVCAWVAALPDKRCVVKGEASVLAFEECAQACGSCGTACVDSTTWHKSGDPAKDCAWVKRFQNRCAAKSSDGTFAFQACRRVCASCDQATSCQRRR